LINLRLQCSNYQLEKWTGIFLTLVFIRKHLEILYFDTGITGITGVEFVHSDGSSRISSHFPQEAF